MSCDEAQLSNKACAVNPLWFFWAISLFVACGTCQPFHWRDSKHFFFCHLPSVQGFLDLLKSTETVYPYVQCWCNGQYFSKCNPIYVRLPHYTLLIHCFMHWNINRDNFARAFDTKKKLAEGLGIGQLGPMFFNCNLSRAEHHIMLGSSLPSYSPTLNTSGFLGLRTLLSWNIKQTSHLCSSVTWTHFSSKKSQCFEK